MNLLLFKKLLFILLLLSSFINCFSQNIVLSEKACVSIITCDTGNESYSLFGHTAIRIKDEINNFDAVYNYGAFDFATPNFVAKFVKGDLQYFAVANTFSDFMSQYTYEKRSVYEQELNIPLSYKQKIYDNLTHSLASSDSYYTYKFIDKNCTSMVVEILNKNLGSNIIVKKVDTEKTYRSILFPYFNGSFFEKLGTSIIFGNKVDEKGDRIFLPLELQKSLKFISFRNNLLSKDSVVLLNFKKETESSIWNNFYIFSILLGFIILVNKKGIDIFYFSIMGILGVFFIFVGFYSFHKELTYNYNILLFNPVLLALVYSVLRKKTKWIVNLSILNLGFLMLYLILMLNKIHLLIVTPLIITSVIILIKTISRNWKRIIII